MEVQVGKKYRLVTDKINEIVRVVEEKDRDTVMAEVVRSTNINILCDKDLLRPAI